MTKHATAAHATNKGLGRYLDRLVEKGFITLREKHTILEGIAKGRGVENRYAPISVEKRGRVSHISTIDGKVQPERECQ